MSEPLPPCPLCSSRPEQGDVAVEGSEPWQCSNGECPLSEPWFDPAAWRRLAAPFEIQPLRKVVLERIADVLALPIKTVYGDENYINRSAVVSALLRIKDALALKKAVEVKP